MTAVRVTAILRQPAACGVTNRADYRQESFDFVPGSVLRGALAAAWLRTPQAPGPAHPDFREVFEGEGSFGPLHSIASPPIPLSGWVHKASPTQRCARWCWDEAYGEQAPNDGCPDCHGELERSKGQPVGSVARVTRTRAALDLNAVAVEAKLYRRSALAAGTVLRGWVSGPAVRALAPAGQPVTTVRLGGQRSIHGLADIIVEDQYTPPAAETIDHDVILRLVAPGIFLDCFGRPTDRPGQPELTQVLGVRAEIIAAWTRWSEVGGWHTASGLPKPRELVMAAGSTYRVECSEPPRPERLSELMTRGIGLRRREGFGALGTRPWNWPRNWHKDTEPILAWKKWSRAAPLFRHRATVLDQGRPDTRLDKIVKDETLTERQREALLALLSIADGAVLNTVLNGLS